MNLVRWPLVSDKHLIQRPSPETNVEIGLKRLGVSIVTVPVGQKMLTHERRNLLVLFGASFVCPNVALCSMSKALRSRL